MKLLNFLSKKVNFIIIITLIIIVLFLLSFKSYTVYGCGGCGDRKPRIKFTFHPEYIINENEKIRNNSGMCVKVGCGFCIKYYYFRFLEEKIKPK